MKYENDPSFKLLPAKLVLVACLYPYEPALTRVFIAERKKKKSFQSRLINCSHLSIIDLSEPIISAVEQVNNSVQSGSAGSFCIITACMLLNCSPEFLLP